MLQAFGLSYEPSPITGKLFEDVNLSVAPGETVALVGANGTGKTKLLDILAGEIAPATGKVVSDSRARIAYLRQDVDLEFEGTLRDYLESAEWLITPLVLPRLCATMGLDQDALDRPYSKLSVGERIRAAIGQILLGEPTILLLDEPSNHLDISGREWLSGFLTESRLACILVSHDRALVNQVAHRVLFLEDGHLSEYSGGYDDMVQAREGDMARRKDRYERQIAEEGRIDAAAAATAQRAAKLTKKRRGKSLDPAAKPFYEAKAAKMHARAKAIRGRAERARTERIEKPFEADTVAISFNSRPLRHSDAITVRSLAKAFGAKSLFENLSLSVGPGDRVAVVGPNGAGKTTLFRILLGEEVADAGELAWSEDAVPAFLSQERARLDLGKTVLEALEPGNAAEATFVRTLLARLRMRGEDVLKPMRALSVGERTKAELVRILMTPANVLLLDEPTNHLDADSLVALECALSQFPGAILFTSHDAVFVERLATEVVRLNE